MFVLFARPQRFSPRAIDSRTTVITVLSRTLSMVQRANA